MAVIKGKSTTTILDTEQRQMLLDRLRKELKELAVDKEKRNELIIFEIPIEQTDKIDVLVVWNSWDNIRSEDRTNLILDSYGDNRERIAQALGVTFKEAEEQQLLPYAVVPMIRKGDVDPEAIRLAMLDEGAFVLAGNKVDLRFPAMSMAESAHKRLCDKLPKGYWSIVQEVAPIRDL